LRNSAAAKHWKSKLKQVIKISHITIKYRAHHSALCASLGHERTQAGQLRVQTPYHQDFSGLPAHQRA
jgi:hypothetical protein